MTNILCAILKKKLCSDSATSYLGNRPDIILTPEWCASWLDSSFVLGGLIHLAVINQEVVWKGFVFLPGKNRQGIQLLPSNKPAQAHCFMFCSWIQSSSSQCCVSRCRKSIFQTVIHFLEVISRLFQETCQNFNETWITRASARPQTARVRISNPKFGGQYHVIRLIIITHSFICATTHVWQLNSFIVRCIEYLLYTNWIKEKEWIT